MLTSCLNKLDEKNICSVFCRKMGAGGLGMLLGKAVGLFGEEGADGLLENSLLCPWRRTQRRMIKGVPMGRILLGEVESQVLTRKVLAVQGLELVSVSWDLWVTTASFPVPGDAARGVGTSQFLKVFCRWGHSDEVEGSQAWLQLPGGPWAASGWCGRRTE